MNEVLPSILADIAAFMGLLTVYPALVERFLEPNGLNALLLSVGFILFCIGVFQLRRLKPAIGDSGDWGSRGWRVVLSIFFAITIGLAITWQLGFFESSPVVDTRDLGEGGSAVYFVFAPGAWLGFAFIYVLVLAFNVTPRIDPDRSWRPVVTFFSLLAVNLMLLLLTAQAAVLSDSPQWLWFSAALAWLLVLFIPPRMIYTFRTTKQGTATFFIILGSFLVLLVACAFQVVSG